MAAFSTPTVHHARLEQLRSLNIPFAIQDFSTLNEFFSIETSAAIPTGQYPSIQYLAIGNGGHQNVGPQIQESLLHGPADAHLFNHIPFIMRPTSNDLTAAERVNYRMRTVANYGGTDYAIYWMRVIDLNAAVPTTTVVEIQAGQVISETPYVPSNASQSPVPVTIDPNDLNLADGRYLETRTPIGIQLTSTDIQEIVNAVNIITGDTRLATISETAVCSGFDRVIVPGATDINEITHAQVMAYITGTTQLQSLPETTTLGFSITSREVYPVS